jgi:hypothetical protein
MELNRKHLEALRLIRSAMIDPADGWDSALKGQVTLSPETYDALNLLIGDGVLDGLVQVGRAQRAWTTFSRVSTDVIRISLPLADWGLGDCVVYRNLGALIGRGQFLIAPPSNFYLIDEAVIVPRDQGNAAVRNYLRAVAFADLLAQQADHIDHVAGTPRLVFLHKVSITVPIVYDETDLAEPIEGLEALQALLASSEHKEQKRSILKAALYDLLATEKEGNRFRRLLGHSKELSQEFRERYQLFVCEFDFDEVREELEEKRSDYLARLNATFNDMGAKLLSIPAAFYTALTEMKPFPAAGSAFEAVVFNTVVTVAVITVSVYILMLLNSQRNTLMATSEEYAGLFARWRSRLKFAEQQEQIDKTLKALDQRKRRLLTYFAITTASVIGTLALTLGLYLLRLFRWESLVWNAVHALKAMLFP